MPNSTSISTESSRSATPTRIQIPFQSGFVQVPMTLRRLVLFVCLHLQQEGEEAGESSPQGFLEADQNQEDDHLMSGALPDNDLCRKNPDRPPCSTDSCASKPREFHRKPLPPRSAPITIPERSPDRSSFAVLVDTHFLSPTSQEVLQQLRQLSEVPKERTPSVLVQLGEDEFWMNSKDADILAKLKQLTTVLSIKEKKQLFNDLVHLLRPEGRYPLRQVLFEDVTITSNGFARVSEVVGDDDLIDLSKALQDCDEKIEDPNVMRPAPLQIRRLGQGAFHEPHILSPLPELKEPQTPAVLSGTKSLPALPPSAYRAMSRRPGSVRTARAALSSPRAASEAQVQKSIEISSPSLLLEQTGSEHSGDIHRPRDLFINPREVPRPPTKRIRDQSPRWSESFRRAHAVLNSPSHLSRHSSIVSIDFHTAPTRIHAPKQSGSVASVANTALKSASVPSEPLSTPLLDSGETSSESLMSKQQGSVARTRVAIVPPQRTSSLPRKECSRNSIESLKKPGSVRRARESLLTNPKAASHRHGEVAYAGSSKVIRTSPVLANLQERRKESDDFPFFRPSRESPRPKNRVPARLQLDDRVDHHESPKATPEVINETAAVRPSPARVLTVNESSYRPVSSQGILVTKQIKTSNDSSCLRGGINETVEAPVPSRPLRKRVSTIFGGVKPLEDDERPPTALWWLAGGRTGGRRKVPTAGELRERREVEEANRDLVGFWRTVADIREVRRLPVAAADATSDEESNDSDAVKAKAPKEDKDSERENGERKKKADGEDGAKEHEHF